MGALGWCVGDCACVETIRCARGVAVVERVYGLGRVMYAFIAMFWICRLFILC